MQYHDWRRLQRRLDALEQLFPRVTPVVAAEVAQRLEELKAEDGKPPSGWDYVLGKMQRGEMETPSILHDFVEQSKQG